MEGNWRPTQSDASMASSMDASSGDWRTQLQPEVRPRIVNKIMETLKRHLPISVPGGLNELRKIAIRFEEKIYAAATSQSDYLRKISLKMLSTETKTQQSAPINPAISNASGVNQNPTDPASMDSTAQAGHAGVVDWQEECYQKSTKEREAVPEKVVSDEPKFSCRICMGGAEKPKEPTFSCPICMSEMVSPYSTVCGHIFCECCIKAAMQRQKECPTCRTKLTGKNNIHRVFLSSAD